MGAAHLRAETWWLVMGESVINIRTILDVSNCLVLVIRRRY